MAQLTIEISDTVADYLELQVSAGHASSVNEFVARVLALHCEGDQIEQKVLAADIAQDDHEVTPDFWQSLRDSVNSKSPAR